MGLKGLNFNLCCLVFTLGHRLIGLVLGWGLMQAWSLHNVHVSCFITNTQTEEIGFVS